MQLTTRRWLFTMAGNPDTVRRVVEEARRRGAGLLVKWADGDPADDGQFLWRRHRDELVQAATAAGVLWGAWAYCYGDKYGHLAAEAAAAREALQRGALLYVVDAETEWDTPAAAGWPARFVAGVGSPQLLAVTTFWNLRYHKAFPAKAWAAAGVRLWMPQVYWGLAGHPWQQVWQVAQEDFGGLGELCPVGQLDQVQAEDVAAWRAAVEASGLPVAWWIADTAPASILDAACPVPPAPAGADLAGQVADLARRVAALEAWAQAFAAEKGGS